MTKFSFWRSGALAALMAGVALTSAPALAQPVEGVQLAQNDERGRGFRERVREARERNSGERREEAGAWRARRDQGAAQARQEQRAAQAPQQAARQGGWRDRRVAESAGQARSWRGQEAQAQQRAWRGQDRAQDGARWRDRRGDGERAWTERSGRTPGYRENARRDDNRWRNDDRRNSSRYGDNRWRNDDRRWDNGWRRDRRYDWRGYRNHNRNLYHVGRYYAPYRGYSYRRFNIGLFLEPVFFGQRYWISDPWQYRLPEVYGPYRWVRYYDDVLLIDIYSGEVVDVIHDFFW